MKLRTPRVRSRVTNRAGRRLFLTPEGLRSGRLVFLITLVISSIALAFALFRPGGVLEVYQLSGRIEAAKEEIEALRGENARLREEIQALREDPRTLERIAREELGLVRPGEKVYEFIGEEERSSP